MLPIILIVILSFVVNFKTEEFKGKNNVANVENGEEMYFIFAEKYSNNKLLNNDEPIISSNLAFVISSSLNENKKFSKEEQEKIVREVVLPKTKTFTYTVKKGESLDIIAKKFGVKKQDIIALNGIKNENFIKAGQKILLPGNQVRISGKIVTNIAPKPIYVTALSNIRGILVPVSGLNQKRIHSNNGIDISAECGSPVYSADEGIVIESADGWNGGYGNYIVIQHKNYETLYGHLSERYVSVGDYVEKGSLIGTVGATGKATGCHLHFETRGIKNPLAY